MTLAERVKQLKQIEARLPKMLEDAATGAAMRAVEKAQELTPPTKNDLRGTHARTGEMKQHWATDSRPKAVKQGDNYASLLANDMEYASYVNDGHRMDRHFVPGLYVNPESGLLEYDPSANVGLVVGTKTSYVPGIFMVDAAKEEYRRTLETELKGLEELLK